MSKIMFFSSDRNPSFRIGYLVDLDGRYIAIVFWQKCKGWKEPRATSFVDFYRPVKETDVTNLRKAGVDDALIAKLLDYAAYFKRALAAAPNNRAKIVLQQQEQLLAKQFFLLLKMHDMAGRVKRALKSGQRKYPIVKKDGFMCYEFGRSGNTALFLHYDLSTNSGGLSQEQITDKRRIIQ